MKPTRTRFPLTGITLTSALLLVGVVRAESFQWQAVPPASQHMDAERLESMRQQLQERKTQSLLVVRNDEIVLEWYAAGHGPEKRHYTASLAKSLVGGLSLALASDDGLIALEDSASKYIPAWRDDPHTANSASVTGTAMVVQAAPLE